MLCAQLAFKRLLIRVYIPDKISVYRHVCTKREGASVREMSALFKSVKDKEIAG